MIGVIAILICIMVLYIGGYLCVRNYRSNDDFYGTHFILYGTITVLVIVFIMYLVRIYYGGDVYYIGLIRHTL